MGVYGPCPARVDAVHDGDTVYLTIDLGWAHFVPSHGLDGQVLMACRLTTADGHGINAPELRTQPGQAALAFAQTLLKPGDRVQVKSFSWDKYGGRFDGAISLPDGSDFGQRMLDAGYAQPLKV